MDESPVDEYERRQEERRRRGERRLRVLLPVCVVLMAASAGLLFAKDAVRLTPYVGLYWDAAFAVGALCALSAGGCAFASLRDWPALPWKWRVTGLVPWPAFVVHIVAFARWFRTF